MMKWVRIQKVVANSKSALNLMLINLSDFFFFLSLETKRNKRSAKKTDSDDERPKKRGKAPKKKSVGDNEYISTNQFQSNVNSDPIQQQGSPALRKKKRGRPPKKKPDELSDSKQESFESLSGAPSMVTVGGDGKLYAGNNVPTGSKN